MEQELPTDIKPPNPMVLHDLRAKQFVVGDIMMLMKHAAEL
jgi:hypothetical protein